MRAIVIGFPKSGTSTIHKSFVESGLRPYHWVYNGKPVGQLVYDGIFQFGDPFALLRSADCVTQMDYCAPKQGLNFWPNLDFNVLLRIRNLYPKCVFILNHRDPRSTAKSMLGWHSLSRRMSRVDIPGLPAGYGVTEDELATWIAGHISAARSIFKGDSAFLDLDITHSDAPELLGKALGIELKWWGIANASNATVERGLSRAPAISHPIATAAAAKAP